jgi:hypothetical protein
MTRFFNLSRGAVSSTTPTKEDRYLKMIERAGWAELDGGTLNRDPVGGLVDPATGKRYRVTRGIPDELAPFAAWCRNTDGEIVFLELA